MVQIYKNHKQKLPRSHDLNQLMLSGQIISPVQVYTSGKMVFTLGNEAGRFFVQWANPQWQLNQGQQVLVRGSIYSVATEKGDTARVHADEVILLNPDNSSWPPRRN